MGLIVYGGTSAIGIIMNPNNGEILALANMNDYDPENYWDFSDSMKEETKRLQIHMNRVPLLNP